MFSKKQPFIKKGLTLLFSLAFCLLNLSPLTVNAQQKKDSAIIRLHEVVIESQKGGDTRKLMPASLTIISKSTLELSPKTDLLQEAAAATPGLFIAGKGIMGSGAGPLASGKIAMRGLISSSNSSMQVLIDGVPMMMGLFGHPLPDAIDQSNIERIEVLRGPSSMLYGGSALAGAINFISAVPAANTHNLNADLSWGSYETVKRSFSASVGKDRYFLQVGYSHNATDGYRKNAAFTGDDYFLRYGFNFSKHWQRVFSLYGSNSTNNDPGTIDNPLLTVTTVHRTLASYKLMHQYENLKGSLTLFYQNGINHFSDGWHSKDYLGGARLEEQFSPFAGNSLLAGGEARWYGGRGAPVGPPSAPLNNVWVRETEQSAFLVMQQKAGELLLLDAGVRTGHHQLFGYTTTPSAGATLTASKDLSIRGLYSQGFRNPTIGELFFFPIANATLKQEKATNLELGTKFKLFQNRMFTEVTLFSTQANNLIFTVPAPVGSVPPVQNFNAKKVSNTGLEWSSRWLIGHNNREGIALEESQSADESSVNTSTPARAAASKSKGIFSSALISVNYLYLQQNKTLLPYSPKHKLNVRVQSSIRKLLINLEYQYISGVYTDFPAVTSAQYALADLALIYPLGRKIKLKVTGNNLFDEKYQMMKGYPMPGRILMGGFSIHL